MNKFFKYTVSGLVVIGLYIFWAIPFRSILNYHEQFQLFQTDFDYFLSHLFLRGGLSVYISEFLIQFYNNYWIGSFVLVFELMLIQWLTLSFISTVLYSWSKVHDRMSYFLSYIPMLIVWIILGDINTMHSLVVSVIIALVLFILLFKLTNRFMSRILGIAFIFPLYIWLAGSSHNRIPYMSLSFDNIYNLKTLELLDYDLLVRSNQWTKIVEKAKDVQPDLPLSVCSTNLALGMTNQLGHRAQEFFQNGTQGLFPSFNKDSFSTLTTAEVYFHLGLINTAQRYYFEAMEAMPNHKKSCRCIRRLAETNLINGQYEVARKYLHFLEKTIFYKKWAQRTLNLIDNGDIAIMGHPLYGRLRRMKLNDDFLFSDKEIDKVCGRLVMHNNDNVLAMQYMLLYPLLDANYGRFVQYMNLLKSEIPYNQELASFEKYLKNN